MVQNCKFERVTQSCPRIVSPLRWDPTRHATVDRVYKALSTARFALEPAYESEPATYQPSMRSASTTSKAVATPSCSWNTTVTVPTSHFSVRVTKDPILSMDLVNGIVRSHCGTNPVSNLTISATENPIHRDCRPCAKLQMHPRNCYILVKLSAPNPSTSSHVLTAYLQQPNHLPK